jgi:hypothetical protein
MSTAFLSLECVHAAIISQDRADMLNRNDVGSGVHRTPATRSLFRLNEREKAAHNAIVELIAERQLHRGQRPDPLIAKLIADELEQQLRRFEPRCNCGRGPLRIGTKDGLKQLSCVCGFKCWQVKT